MPLVQAPADCSGQAAVGDDEAVAPHDRPWFEELKAEAGPVRIIEPWTIGGRQILERSRPCSPLFVGLSAPIRTSPRSGASTRGQRRIAFRALADLLADRAALRSGLRWTTPPTSPS
jgi:hypothetical protein